MVSSEKPFAFLAFLNSKSVWLCFARERVRTNRGLGKYRFDEGSGAFACVRHDALVGCAGRGW